MNKEETTDFSLTASFPLSFRCYFSQTSCKCRHEFCSPLAVFQPVWSAESGEGAATPHCPWMEVWKLSNEHSCEGYLTIFSIQNIKMAKKIMGETVFYFNELLCDIRICEKSSSTEKIIELMLFSLFLLTRPQSYEANSVIREIKRQLHSTKSERRSLFYCNLVQYGWITTVKSCIVWLIWMFAMIPCGFFCLTCHV